MVLQQAYDKDLTSFTDQAQDIVASGAEALAMITFQEGGQLFLDLESAGFDGQIYVADGFVDNVNDDGVPDLTQSEGIRGTYPAGRSIQRRGDVRRTVSAFAPDGTRRCSRRTCTTAWRPRPGRTGGPELGPDRRTWTRSSGLPVMARSAI